MPILVVPTQPDAPSIRSALDVYLKIQAAHVVQGNRPCGVVVPLEEARASRWRDRARALWVEQGLLVLPELVEASSFAPRSAPGAAKRAVKGGATADDEISPGCVEVLQKTISDAIRTCRVDGASEPMVVVVLVANVQASDVGVPGLAKTRAALVHAADALRARVRGLEASAHAGAEIVRVIPWVWFDTPPAHLDDDLFAGIPVLSTTHVTPLIHTASDQRGVQHTWETFGSMRLVTELLALGALAQSKPDLERVFPSSEDRRRFHIAHSAMLDCSSSELQVLSWIEALRAQDAVVVDGEAVAPHIGTGAAIANAQAAWARDAEVSGRVEQQMQTIRDLHLRGIDRAPYLYRSDGRGEGALSGPQGTRALDLTAIGPFRDVPGRRWPLLTREEWPMVAPKLGAGVVARRVRDDLARIEGHEVAEEYRRAREEIAAEVAKIEKACAGDMRQLFDMGESAAHGYAAVMAYVEALRTALALTESDDATPTRARASATPGPETQASRDGTSIEERWLKLELACVEAGRDIPSVGGALMPAALVVLAAISMVMVLWFIGPFTLIILALGCVWAGFLAAGGIQTIRRHMDAWDDLRAQFTRDANRQVNSLLDEVDERVADARRSVTAELRAGLAAVARRLTVEMDGLAALLAQEQNAIEAREAWARSLTPPDAYGYFTIAFEKPPPATVDGAELRASLGSLWGATMQPTRAGTPIEIVQYERLMRPQEGATRSVEIAQNTAATALETMLDHVLNAQKLPSVEGGGAVDTSINRVLISGVDLLPHLPAQRCRDIGELPRGMGATSGAAYVFAGKKDRVAAAMPAPLSVGMIVTSVVDNGSETTANGGRS